MVIDTDDCEKDYPVLCWRMTREEARIECRKANRIAGYTSTCVVVRYESSPFTRKDSGTT